MKDQDQERNDLSEAVRDLGKAFELLKDMFDSGQRRYESLSHQLKIDHDKEFKRQRRDAYIIAILGIVGICASVIVASFWDYQGKKAAFQQALVTKEFNQANEVQQQIDNQLKKRDQLMAAMIGVRTIRDLGQKLCKNGKYAGDDSANYKQKLYSASFALSSAAYQMTGIFNEAIKDKIHDFGELEDVDRKDICDSTAAKDNDLRALQTEINNMILQSVEQLQAKKDALLKKVGVIVAPPKWG